MDNDRMQIAVYRINKEIELFAKEETQLVFLERHIQAKGYHHQDLDKGIENYEIKLFYKTSLLRPKWKAFFADTVRDDQDILKNDLGFSESFVMLLSNIVTGNLYAVTGGSGFHEIQDYIDDNFGVDILSRIINKNEKILKSVKEKSVIGGIMGSTKFFRKKYNLSENDSFGKIYQELNANLNRDILQIRFGFSADETQKELTCIAKTSFKINKAITFAQISKIISGCEYVLENPDHDPGLEPTAINSVEKISNKKNRSLVSSLDEELIAQLWKRYNDRSEVIDFDLCHQDFEKYLTATKYIVCKGNSLRNFFGEIEFKDEERLDTIDKLFETLRLSDEAPADLNSFRETILTLTIYSYNDEEDRYLTKGSLLGHIFGDVSFKGRTYFLIDRSWYEIKDSFIEDLNSNCSRFINDHYNERLDIKWDTQLFGDENAYNKQYINMENTLVLDKIIPENIEPCDILKWDEENLYLFHVKAGFGNTMRDLCSQVFVAANRLQADKATTAIYINKIYDELLKRKGSKNEYFSSVGKQTDTMTREAFVELFNTKKLVFVLSVRDTSTKTERAIRTEISKFGSNIAKFSLQELVKGMRGIDVAFEFSQIYKK